MQGVPSGKRFHNYGKSSCIFHGKTHYFYGHVQCRKLLVYQRVNVMSPFSMAKSTKKKMAQKKIVDVPIKDGHFTIAFC